MKRFYSKKINYILNVVNLDRFSIWIYKDIKIAIKFYFNSILKAHF